VLLRRLYIIKLDSRRVCACSGVTEHPTGEWVVQQSRNLMMSIGEQMGGFRHLIRDRDATYERAA